MGPTGISILTNTFVIVFHVRECELVPIFEPATPRYLQIIAHRLEADQSASYQF